ncbi:MAG: hypothetical protein PHW52_04630, partial [Candidatus Pacebacteria bacterium]|nr:hypothetical protein [Candidatus Paceibacterota bacterium]
STKTYIVRKQGSIPANKDDGLQIYDDNGNAFIAMGLTTNTQYCYAAYATDNTEYTEPVTGCASTISTGLVFDQTTDGNYIIDKFTLPIGATASASANWTPPAGVTQVEYLVVGGGGAGGYRHSGGGGGGGVRRGIVNVNSSLPVTVGAGGKALVGSSSKGGDSRFQSIYASGGGYGGSYAANPSSGGSGGGSQGSYGAIAGASGNLGGYTPAEGYTGGTGNSTKRAGGGGGGAGTAGMNATSNTAGNGGDGVVSSITGISTYYGGGGGGGAYQFRDDLIAAGAGGLGGGGHGGFALEDHVVTGMTTGVNGLGGGGGGFGDSASNWTGAAGGSGVVIIRYMNPSAIVDGGCGTASNIEHVSIPTTNLCSAGIVGSVTGDGVPYSWTCSGQNGGTTANCEATKNGWINTGLGFYVMKYEAKIQGSDAGNQTYSSSYVAESRTSGTPWVNINQTQAIAECAALGSGYHLITNAERTSLARNIAIQASNWSTGTAGSGTLSRGYSASNTNASDGFTNTVASPNTGIGYEYNTGANTVGPSGVFALKRTHKLSNGQTIWDLAGNVWELNSGTCTQGAGVGNWHNSAWLEWNDTNLTDYELGMAGPSPLYTSTQNAGRYYGCTATGNGMSRGSDWGSGLYVGIFALNLSDSPSNFNIYIGFRCAR